MNLLSGVKITKEIEDYKVQETLDLFNPQLVGIIVYSLGYQGVYNLSDEIKSQGSRFAYDHTIKTVRKTK